MQTFVHGRHPVYHLLKAGRRKVHQIFLQEGQELVEDPIVKLSQQRKIPIKQVPKGFFARFGDLLHQGVVAETDPYPYCETESLLSLKILVLCDEIQDPQNLGAICRSAYLFGAEGMVILSSRSAGVSATVCKASSGSVEYLKMAQTSSLPKVLGRLKESGFWIYGADQEGEKVLYEEVFPDKVALVIGGEDKGLGRLVRERCDILLKIPMTGREIGSFNAATAASILLYELFRQRSKS